jgi:hypothetical protein
MYNCIGDKKLSGNNILDLMHAGLLQVYKLQNQLYKLMPQLAYFLTFPLPFPTLHFSLLLLKLKNSLNISISNLKHQSMMPL